MELLFWISSISVLYIYVGYPLILTVVALFRKLPVIKADIFPSVSLIVAAYNEEKDIEEKIKNSLSLDYPKDKFEVIIASDCSTDRTDEISGRYSKEGVRLVRLRERGGKTAAQNHAVTHANGEILVFSDATTIFAADCIKKIVRNFNDSGIGCVGGQIIFKKSGGSMFSGEKNTSEKYDEYIRGKEAEIKTTFGLTGCLYATRRVLYTPLANDQTSDFVLPLRIIEKGYRVVCDPDAIGYEEIAANMESEFKRRIRTTRAGMKGLSGMLHLVFFSSGLFVAFGLISHKVLRWLSPYFILGALIANAAILNHELIYKLTFVFQIIFYLLVLAGFQFEKMRHKPKIFTLPFNFVMVNMAAVFGLAQFLIGHNEEIWQTERA